MLQRSAANDSPMNKVPPIVHEVLTSPGQPLDAETRAFMEPRFERDFSQVRVHTDAKAAESAQAVGALAYTVGQHIVFDQGLYTTSSANGRRLAAHELAHTIQQANLGSGQALAIDSSGSSFEREAGWAAEVALSSVRAPSPMVARNPLISSTPERPIIQRQGARRPACRDGRLSRQQYLQGIDWLVERQRLTVQEASNLREHIPDSRRARCRQIERLSRRRAQDRIVEPPPQPSDATPALAPESSCKVDVRATHIGGFLSHAPVWHLFIVYTDSIGTDFFFRGGPRGSCVGAAPGGYGTIQSASGPYVPGTVDWDPGAPSVTILSGSSTCGKDTCFSSELSRIDSLCVPYNPTGPNSNTVARTLLSRCGIPQSKPVLIAPGWGDPVL
jgi:hypothetical protein